jgi:hypothetical protein
MVQRLLFFGLVILLSLNSAAVTQMTVVETAGNSKTITQYEADQKTLRNKTLRDKVQDTAEAAIYLEWDEGIRDHLGFRDEEASQFHIESMWIEDGVVMSMAVQVHGVFSLVSQNAEAEVGNYSCMIDLERFSPEDDLAATYAVCETEFGEELEYEVE